MSLWCWAGGGGDRARRAAELFLAGAAPRVLVSGEGDTAQNRRLLIRHGVPAAAIAVEPDSRNTQENARFTAPWLRDGRDASHRVPNENGRDEFHLVPNSESQEQDQGRGGTRPYQSQGQWKASLPAEGARQVILVTSWYHSRRALQCFRHYVPGIQFYSRPAYYAYPRSEWDREGIRPFIRLEYLKLVAYWVRYGVWPMGTGES